MKTRSYIWSYIWSILGAACVIVLPPVLVSAAVQHGTLPRNLLPLVPLSLVRVTPSAPPVTPVANTMPVAAAAAPAAAGIALDPLPSHELAVTLENVNTEERATFHLASRGYIRASEAAAVENFFRCRRTGKHRPIHPATLALLADIAQNWPGRVIEVVSGYRSPPCGAPHSRHFLGHAIDLRVRGVRTAKVRDWVWRNHQGLGVGHYSAGNFLHVDHRDEDTAWSAREESSRYDYNPRWARRARRGLPATGPTLAAR